MYIAAPATKAGRVFFTRTLLCPMLKNISSIRKGLLLALATCSGLAPLSPVNAQLHIITNPHVVSSPVSGESLGVVNTGAAQIQDRWYNDNNNQPRNEAGGFTFQVDGFCWDGGTPGVSWRLRRHHKNINSFDVETTVTGQVWNDVKGEHGQLGDFIPLPRGAKDPDIAVGLVVAQQEFSDDEDGWGRGNYYLIVGYHIADASNNYVNKARLNIYLLQNPRDYPASTSTVTLLQDPRNPNPEYSVELGPGQNVNVDYNAGEEFANGEFAFTYIAGDFTDDRRAPPTAPSPTVFGQIMGGFGKVYTEEFGGSGISSNSSGPGFHHPITTINEAVVTQIALTQSINNTEPDASYANFYQDGDGIASFVWTKESRQELDVYGLSMRDIIGMGYPPATPSVPSVPPAPSVVATTLRPNDLMVYQFWTETGTFYGTSSHVYKPRIESWLINRGGIECKVVYKERQPASKGNCDQGSSVAVGMINVLTLTSGNIHDPNSVPSKVQTTLGTHVNLCMASEEEFINDDPAIASESTSGDALVAWTASRRDGTNATQNLEGQDIVGHTMIRNGFPQGPPFGGYGTYITRSYHYRINNAEQDPNWHNMGPPLATTDNHRAVSLAGIGSSAWYDVKIMRVISHDFAFAPNQYRSGGAGDTPEPEVAAGTSVKRGAVATTAVKGSLSIVPNPDGSRCCVNCPAVSAAKYPTVTHNGGLSFVTG